MDAKQILFRFALILVIGALLFTVLGGFVGPYVKKNGKQWRNKTSIHAPIKHRHKMMV